MKFGLSLGQVEAGLAALHDVADDRRAAFQARIKHLQKLGFPPGTNTGKGRRARYGLEAIAKLVAAFELMQFGMMPNVAIEFVESEWSFVRVVFASAMHEILTGEIDGMFGLFWLWMINPQALSDLTDDQGAFGASGAFRVKSAEASIWQEWHDGQEGWRPYVGRGHRHMLINVTWAIDEFFDNIGSDSPTGRDALDDLEQWRFSKSSFESLRDDIGRWGLPYFEGKIVDDSDPQA